MWVEDMLLIKVIFLLEVYKLYEHRTMWKQHSKCDPGSALNLFSVNCVLKWFLHSVCSYNINILKISMFTTEASRMRIATVNIALLVQHYPFKICCWLIKDY